MGLIHAGMARHGMAVFAHEQTRGKGQWNRQWLSQKDQNIAISLIIEPQSLATSEVFLLSMAIAEGTYQFFNCYVPESVAIKWPNDILIGNRKVAGILIETSHDQTGRMIAIVGIGVNVNGQSDQLANHITGSAPVPQRPGATATTLQTACGHVVSRETLIAHLLHHLENFYLELQQEAEDPVAMVSQATSRFIREQWRSQLSTLGRYIEVRQGNTLLSGVAEDVNDTGELLLRSHSGNRVSITWGDIGYPTE